MERDSLTETVIGCAIEVHRNLGPGLHESAYEACLAYELAGQEIVFQTQVPLPIDYKGTKISCGYRMGLLINKELLLELKSVDGLTRVHEEQILHFMRMARVRTGMLINFNVPRLIGGISRFRL